MNWLTPANSHVHNKGKDVHISVVGKKLPMASIKFYGNSESNIVKNGDGSIQIAIVASRLYFKEAGHGEIGFSLGKDHRQCVTRRLQTTNYLLIDFCTKHRGAYNLKYDTMRKLYYIDTVEEG